MAGAGTGKTARLAERFANLVAAGVAPGSILVMTFTERASSEMRARIERKLGTGGEGLHVGTFHSMAQAWLRQDGHRLGIPASFRILRGPERWVLLRELMWELGADALVATDHPDDLVSPLLKMLERLKQELVPRTRLRAWALASADRERAEVVLAACDLFAAYEAGCRRRRLLDFEDLITEAVSLLARFPELRHAYAKRFSWILVDEYQDTNLAQERLVELLAEQARNVFVVGDDDQSIYRFRGASRASMERFASSFPECATLAMGVNRRSTGNIVSAAAALIEHNPGRLQKRLEASSEPGALVELNRHPTGDAEMAALAAQIRRLHDAGLPYGSVAVLTRTNAVARAVQPALLAAGIPHRVWGATGLYQEPEVKDAIAILRLLEDEQDSLGKARLRERGLDLDLAPLRGLPAVLGVNDLLFEGLERTRYLDRRPGSGRERIQERGALGLARFAELVDEYCETRADHSLRLFLEHLELLLLADVDEELPALDEAREDEVQVMTIHRAKGLEFEAVFVPSIVEGRLPQRGRGHRLELPAEVVERAVQGREDHLAEERRLLYVAMTRARRHLFLSWADRYGRGRWRRSRFIDELLADASAACTLSEQVAGDIPSSALSEAAAASAADSRPVPDPKVALSFSSVSTYRECPRQYRFRYLDRVPARQSPEAQYGALLHEALLAAGRAAQSGTNVSGPVVEEILDEVFSRARFHDDRRARVFRRLASAQLGGFAAAGGFDSVPALLEHAFSLEAPAWRLVGVIDRVDRTQTGWRILDYKTGSPLPKSALRRDLQLALYALAAREALQLEPVELEIRYLREGRRVSVEATAPLLAEARHALDEAAAGVSAGSFEARPERGRCRRCPYRLACTEAL